MRAGSQRHLVSVQERVETQDEFGEAKPTWTETTKAWVGIYPLRGGEKYTSMEKHATATHELSMRYTTLISAKHRVVMASGRTFDILSVLNVAERNKQLKLIVEEQV